MAVPLARSLTVVVRMDELGHDVLRQLGRILQTREAILFEGRDLAVDRGLAEDNGRHCYEQAKNNQRRHPGGLRHRSGVSRTALVYARLYTVIWPGRHHIQG